MPLSIRDQSLLYVLDAYRRFHGYSFQRARDDKEKEEFHSFAKKVFYDEGFFNKDETPLKVPSDGCQSDIGAVSRKGEIAGVVDVVRSTGLFPLEYFYNIELPNGVERHEVAEVTRLAIDRRFRKKNSIVSAVLFSHALRSCHRNGIRYWIACAPAWLRQGFRAFFPHVENLPELELTNMQREYRRFRESYFDPRRSTQVFLIDLSEFCVLTSARELVRRSSKRRRWKSARLQK